MARLVLCMCVCINVCLYLCIYVYICIYVCIYACVYVCMNECIYVCMSVCVYVCMCVCKEGCMEKVVKSDIVNKPMEEGDEGLKNTNTLFRAGIRSLTTNFCCAVPVIVVKAPKGDGAYEPLVHTGLCHNIVVAVDRSDEVGSQLISH